MLLSVTLLLSLALTSCGGAEHLDNLFGTQTDSAAELISVCLPWNQNREISRLDSPITVEIYNGVTVDLQYQGWPTITKGKDGTLYAVSSVRTEHIDIFGAVGFTKSTDNGNTWEPMRLIIDTPIDDRDTGIVYLGDDHLMVTWGTNNASAYREGGIYGAYRDRCTPAQLEAIDARLDSLDDDELRGASWVMHSYDGGLTWGDKIELPITSPHGASLMQDGKGLICMGRPTGMSGTALNSKSLYSFESYDSGYTWTQKGEFPLPGFFEGKVYEAYIIQLKDSSFLAAFRSELEGLATYTMYSEDGVHWNNYQFVCDGSPPHLLELQNGVILLTYASRQYPTGARGRLSFDGGKTWGKEIEISKASNPNDWDLGYASSIELNNGCIITAYYQKMKNDTYCSLLYTKWYLQ